MKKLYKNEKIIRVITPLGISMGEFIATKGDLPLLIELNKDPRGCVYFRWSGIRVGECY